MPNKNQNGGGGGLERPKPESPRGRARPRSRPDMKTSAINQVTLRNNGNGSSLQALSQFRQVVRSGSGRTALAYNLSKDLFLVLRYLPSGIYSRLQNSLSTQLNLSANSRNNNNGDIPSHQGLQNDSQQVGRRSVLTDLYGKAAYATIFVREKMLNRNLSSAPGNNSSSEENELVAVPPTKATTELAPKEKSVIVVKSAKDANDWNSDPDLKPFLRDMNLEWKNIEARTRYLVSKVNSVVEEETRSKLRYVEDLYKHLCLYREARITAVESGAVKSLSRILKRDADEACLTNVVRETLAVLGSNPPLKGHGIKVLSIDGGGVRGLVAIEVLRIMERQTGKKVHELFDYICGVSTGSILAFLIGAHRRTLDECEALYKQLSQEIFNQNSIIGAGNLFWSHSYYDTAAWEKILKRHIGEVPLLRLARDPDLPRVAAISTIVNQERVTPYVFRTYAFRPGARSRYSGGSNYQMWEAVRASAAAPTYFEEVKLGNNLHQDGGVLVNNPSSVALSEAKTLWAGYPLQTVISLGTGQTFSSRKDRNMSDLSASPNPQETPPNSLSWKGKFLKVLDSATDTESVHHTLMELLPPHVYFRFNPHLAEMITMDEARPEKLDKLQSETREYLLRNMDKVEYCCEMLTKPKGVTRRVLDWWSAIL